MTKEDFNDLPHGVYRIFWKTGGQSVASVGSLSDGRRWLAPANWTSDIDSGISTSEYWDEVRSVKLIATQYACEE